MADELRVPILKSLVEHKMLSCSEMFELCDMAETKLQVVMTCKELFDDGLVKRKTCDDVTRYLITPTGIKAIV